MLPVLQADHDEGWGSFNHMLAYLKKRRKFEPEYTQVPRKITADLDVDRHWKMLLLSRRILDMGELARYIRREKIEIEFDDPWEIQGIMSDFNAHPTRSPMVQQKMTRCQR